MLQLLRGKCLTEVAEPSALDKAEAAALKGVHHAAGGAIPTSLWPARSDRTARQTRPLTCEMKPVRDACGRCRLG